MGGNQRTTEYTKKYIGNKIMKGNEIMDLLVLVLSTVVLPKFGKRKLGLWTFRNDSLMLRFSIKYLKSKLVYLNVFVRVKFLKGIVQHCGKSADLLSWQGD